MEKEVTIGYTVGTGATLNYGVLTVAEPKRQAICITTVDGWTIRIVGPELPKEEFLRKVVGLGNTVQSAAIAELNKH